jgi:hypothetical protein
VISYKTPEKGVMYVSCTAQNANLTNHHVILSLAARAALALIVPASETHNTTHRVW